MQRPSRSASLRPEERPTAPRGGLARARRDQLWLAVVLPQLALDAISTDRTHAADEPAAVYEFASGQLRIVAVNAAGRQAGVGSGFTVSAALALLGTLALYERSPSAEDACLAELADRVSRFTPKVCLEPREGVLLEVSASLRLFGGFGAVRRMLGDELRTLAAEFRIGAAPTALAALWSARQGNTHRPARHELAGHLGRLPLAVTGWSGTVQQRLREMGVRTIGECLRLPRDGFARRVGRACLDDLDKALGRRSDPRPFYSTPGVIDWSMDFARETADMQQIAAAVEAGIDSVAADLLRRQKQIRRLQIELVLLRGGADTTVLEFVDPLHAASDLLAPIRVRLESFRLAGPVTSVNLKTGPLLPLRPDPGVLFEAPGGGTAPTRSRAVLVECLRGRFGREGVYGLRLHAEHRPELAFRRLTESLVNRQDGTAAVIPDASVRPLWLLPEPVRLTDDVLRSMACADTAPERIESGWWDGADVRRDYYIVTTGDGERWWVYRDRVTREWRLHGVFG